MILVILNELDQKKKQLDLAILFIGNQRLTISYNIFSEIFLHFIGGFQKNLVPFPMVYSFGEKLEVAVYLRIQVGQVSFSFGGHYHS